MGLVRLGISETCDERWSALGSVMDWSATVMVFCFVRCGSGQVDPGHREDARVLGDAGRVRGHAGPRAPLSGLLHGRQRLPVALPRPNRWRYRVFFLPCFGFFDGNGNSVSTQSNIASP